MGAMGSQPHCALPSRTALPSRSNVLVISQFNQQRKRMTFLCLGVAAMIAPSISYAAAAIEKRSESAAEQAQEAAAERLRVQAEGGPHQRAPPFR